MTLEDLDIEDILARLWPDHAPHGSYVAEVAEDGLSVIVQCGCGEQMVFSEEQVL